MQAQAGTKNTQMDEKYFSLELLVRPDRGIIPNYGRSSYDPILDLLSR